MKNKLFSTVALLIVLLVLATIAWYLTVTQETALNKNLVLNLPETDIIGFDITKINEAQKTEKMSVHKKNEGNNWVITSPVQDITDPGTISLMIASLKEVRTPTIIKNVAELSEYGLDRPALMVVIHLQKGKTITLNFGSESPIPEMYYASLNGLRDVVVIHKDIKNNLSPNLAYLRDRRVLNLTGEHLQELAVKIDQSQEYRMVNTGGSWNLIEPYRKELHNKDVNAIIEGLNALWIHENDDNLNNLAEYGLDQPQYQLEFKLTDGKSFSLIANKLEDDYYMFNSLRPTIIKQKNPDAFNFLKTNLQNL